MFPALQLPRSLEAPLITNSLLEYQLCTWSSLSWTRWKGSSLRSRELMSFQSGFRTGDFSLGNLYVVFIQERGGDTRILCHSTGLSDSLSNPNSTTFGCVSASQATPSSKHSLATSICCISSSLRHSNLL